MRLANYTEYTCMRRKRKNGLRSKNTNKYLSPLGMLVLQHHHVHGGMQGRIGLDQVNHPHNALSCLDGVARLVNDRIWYRPMGLDTITRSLPFLQRFILLKIVSRWNSAPFAMMGPIQNVCSMTCQLSIALLRCS